MKLLLALSLLTISLNTFAGDDYYGNSSNRDDACDRADARARASAKSKNTCYEQCDVRQCKKEKDGTFTCSASSADYRSSCGAETGKIWP